MFKGFFASRAGVYARTHPHLSLAPVLNSGGGDNDIAGLQR